jgi:ubiquinone/menaquinone biosynthesis C-methylase UbiE
MGQQHYTFGDNDRAAQRLRGLAAAYESTSAALLARFAGSFPMQVADLGAGLGFTTRLAHEITDARTTVGLDASARYVALANKNAPSGIRHMVHDVTRAPFPGGEPDFVYARFLLTHLAQPGVVLATWREASALGAMLVLEETAELTSEHPALRRYYAMVEAMQEYYGQALRIGRALAELATHAGWRVIDHHVTSVPISGSQMARLHVENIRTWKNDPFAVSHVDPDDVAEVEEQLDAIAEGRDEASVVAAMGQLVALR